jgi:hypothetical protein
MDPEALAKFDDILKVDMSNKLQFDMIYNSLCLSMEVICFWMNEFVFPLETYQFPSKRATNAWNLADSNTVGFSGTDDNRFLLPLSVLQKPAKKEALRATNGHMIDLILKSTQKKIRILDSGTSDELKLWEIVVKECQTLRTRALIDVAGLMAGSRNHEVAERLASSVDASLFRGVVYFNADSKTWNVYEMENKRDMPLRNSSLAEAECFVYFDESRCRGSDMKLRNEACALVTLEPKMTKDKFLQGCARMRKLRPNGQSLILAGTSEVVSSNSSVKGVLERIVRNTATMTGKALPTFYERGTDFFSFPDAIDVDDSLDTLYASPLCQYEDFGEFLDASHETHETSDQKSELVSYCKDIGKSTSVYKSCLTQECERELEHEMEEEEEEEIQLAKHNPYTQIDWEDFALAFQKPEHLFQTLFLSLKQFIREKLHGLSSIEWSDKLYCTPNFCRTIQKAESSKDLSLYLRLVNPMLVLGDGRVVLISMYELDKLLPHWWSAKNPKAVLRHLSLSVRSGLGFGNETIEIPANVMPSIKLFRGYVDYSEQELTALSGMFKKVVSPRSTVEELLFMRNRLTYFEQSDLDGFSFSLLVRY